MERENKHLKNRNLITFAGRGWGGGVGLRKVALLNYRKEI